MRLSGFVKMDCIFPRPGNTYADPRGNLLTWPSTTFLLNPGHISSRSFKEILMISSSDLSRRSLPLPAGEKVMNELTGRLSFDWECMIFELWINISNDLLGVAKEYTSSHI